MKLKQSPADFRVEELTDLAGGAAGEFSLYRLTKTGWTTPDAINKVRRRWSLDAGRVGYGGLKDRHAVTTQHLTVFRGPHADLALQGVSLEYLGRVPGHFRAEMIRANRFTIKLRHLTEPALALARRAAEAVALAGVPNYFDDQRFGSVGRGLKFVGKEMVKGDFESALKLALAEPYEHDRAAAKAEKALLRAKWGDWVALKAELPRGHARSLVDYLRQHPADFKGAVARLRPELGGLYLAAYQSYVWNRALDCWLRDRLPAESLGAISLSVGEFAAPAGGDSATLAAFEALVIPLPSARLEGFDAGDRRGAGRRKPHARGGAGAGVAEAVLFQGGARGVRQAGRADGDAGGRRTEPESQDAHPRLRVAARGVRDDGGQAGQRRVSPANASQMTRAASGPTLFPSPYCGLSRP